MKEINGTTTLAFVEEDNRQRVIFRVIPLCTREGGTFHGGAEEFPDEGSLRIVPDKREQSTFKERMREIGGLCVIQLAADGKELMKVRQNRNYAPDQGEKNQFAIYSDVICEFVEDGCFEVIESAQAAEKALTAKVLFQKNKMLYGPVARQEAAGVDLESLKPFGNDRFLLHTIEAPQVGRHVICWDPEAVINWRQRRSSLRRKDRSAQEETVETPAAATESAAPAEEKKECKVIEVKTSKQVSRMDPHTRRVERAAEILRQQEEEERRQQEKREKAAARKQEKHEKHKEEKQPVPVEEKPAPQSEETEDALPIGTRLDILDSALPFEQQISRLAQPLSESANRLTSDTPVQEEEETPEAVAHFSGTPLKPNKGKPIRIKTKAENVHHVVEQQIQGQRDEVMGSELGAGSYGMVSNPIETLRACMEYVWQNADMRDQAVAMMMENEAFAADMTSALRKGGVNLHVSAAAQEQLAEIEAERISLLMQLDMAKDNNKKFREEAIALAAQKKRDEVERLKNEVKQLEATRKKLSEAAKQLSQSNADQLKNFVTTHMTCMSGNAEDRVLLTPVLGREYTQQEMAEQLRIHMNESGFSINEDEAMSMLISFSLYDAVCFRARTLQDAQLFAAVLLESFGLQSVSASLRPGAHVELVSMLAENARRTPTVTVQPVGTETITVFGHKTVYLADTQTLPAEMEKLLQFPVISIPSMVKRAFGRTVEWNPVEPAALSSFAGIRADGHPMLSEGEKWFSDLKRVLQQENVVVSDAMYACMRRFIEVAMRKVRGGFLSAADIAVSHWIVPLLAMHSYDPEKVMSVLSGLPRTLEQLGVR